jgi:hypothetical protein
MIISVGTIIGLFMALFSLILSKRILVPASPNFFTGISILVNDGDRNAEMLELL